MKTLKNIEIIKTLIDNDGLDLSYYLTSSAELGLLESGALPDFEEGSRLSASVEKLNKYMDKEGVKANIESVSIRIEDIVKNLNNTKNKSMKQVEAAELSNEEMDAWRSEFSKEDNYELFKDAIPCQAPLTAKIVDAEEMLFEMDANGVSEITLTERFGETSTITRDQAVKSLHSESIKR